MDLGLERGRAHSGSFAVLWSGGKDCFRALLLASAEFGVDPSAFHFVTFVPAVGGFRCHPLGVLARQVQGLGGTWERLVVRRASWRRDYDVALRHLRKQGVSLVVSGDQLSGEAAVRRHWLSGAAADAGLTLSAPTAGLRTPVERVAELAAVGITAVVTCVADERDRALLGQPLSIEALREIGRLDDASFDACGENGEYHTVVTAFRGKPFVDEPLRAGATTPLQPGLALRYSAALRADHMPRRRIADLEAST